MKKMMLLFSILVFLFLGNVASAETDLLNLGSYNEGDTLSYGKNVIVGQDETTDVKWITGVENDSGFGRLVFPIQLSGDFEVITRARVSGESIFIISDEYKIEIKNLRFLRAGDKKADGPSSISSNGISDIKLSVINNVAKLYIDDLFISKIILKPDLVYTQLMISRIDNNSKFYEFDLAGDSNTTTSRPTSASDIPNNILLGKEFDKGKKEGIQQCVDNPSSCGIDITSTNTGTVITDDCTADYTNGQLHIPCVAVSDPFGGKTIYDIKMNQQSGSFTFDLDMGSVKPR